MKSTAEAEERPLRSRDTMRDMAPLTVGTQAPAFTALRHDGQKVRLAEFEGQAVWLIFYRYAGCPLCNLHLMELSLWLDALNAKDLTILGVFESSPEEFGRVRPMVGPIPFVMLSDPSKKLYAQYGVESRLGAALRPNWIPSWVKALTKGIKQGPLTGEVGQVPGHFLIDEQGVIRRAHYGRHIDDHIDWSEVQSFLAERPGARKTGSR